MSLFSFPLFCHIGSFVQHFKTRDRNVIDDVLSFAADSEPDGYGARHQMRT